MKRSLGILGMVWISGHTISSGVSALTLEEYLGQVREKNGIFEASSLSQEAAEAKRVTGDLELSPYLTGKIGYLDDQAKQLSPFSGTRTQSKNYSLGVAKRFATGTSLAMNFSQGRTMLTGVPFVIAEPWSNAVTLSLSQSLYKDIFGAGTRLRRERESAVARLEKIGQEIQARQLLIAAEAAFWDSVYQNEEIRVRKESLDRARRLTEWVQKRFDSGIGDASDTLQAQSSVSLREIQLLTSEDERIAALRTLSTQIQSGTDKNLEQLTGDLDKADELSKLVGTPDPVRLDALAKSLEAEVRKTVSEEFENGTRPDLVIQGAYAMNARKATGSGTLSDTFQTDHPTKSIGLQFTMDLDRSSVNKARRGMEAEARASDLRSQQAFFESKTSWEELQRRYKVLSERIKIMEKLAKINGDRMKRENERLKVGRTTTFQVISFEQESAETQIQLVRMKTERRKLESQARMFVAKNFSEEK